MRTSSTTQSSTPATPYAPKPFKKISFGTIAKKKDDAKPGYPIYADPLAAEIATRIIERQEEFEALEAALKTDKAELKMLASPFYFNAGHGKAEVQSSVKVPGTKDRAVLVCYQNRYGQIANESAIQALLGEERLSKYFRQSYALTIDGDKLLSHKAEDLLARLQELFAEHGATEALSGKEGIRPVDDFHVRRHLELTPDENLALDQLCPIVAQIKTKNVK